MLRRIIRESYRSLLREGEVFPGNLLGTNLNFTDNSNEVFICGDYHGRYEDDDFGALFYDLTKKTFFEDGWSTRGACSSSVFNRPYININRCSPEIQNEIMERAKEVAKTEKRDHVLKEITQDLRLSNSKSYSQKTLAVTLQEIEQRLDEFIDMVNELPVAISLIYNESYFGYDTSKYFVKFTAMVEEACQNKIKKQLDIKNPRKVKVYGKNFTGRVVKVEPYYGAFGTALKVGIVPEEGGKSIWGIINYNSMPERGEVITLNGIVVSETERSITISKAKRVDGVDPSQIEQVV